MTVTDGTYMAVVDRVVEGHAVLLVEDERAQLELSVETIQDEFAETLDEGEMVRIEIVDGTVRALDRRPEETAIRRERLREKFDRLAERPPDDDSE